MQKMPAKLFFQPPMECNEVRSEADLPSGHDWQYEVKFDGYRCIAAKQLNEVEIYSRRGLVFKKFLNIYRLLGEQPVRSFMLDGEIVALDESGRSSFNTLQNSGPSFPVHFYAFDLLHLDGQDMTGLPLSKRQARLVSAFVPNEFIHIPQPLQAKVSAIIKKIRQFAFEGIVAKRKESRYIPGKTSGDWLKLKLKPTEEFIVGGFIPGSQGIDQLVVGRYAGKQFMYVASLDDGFVPATRKKVFDAIKRNAIADCPFVNLPEKRGAHRMDREKMLAVTWVKPRVVVEIAMNEWTPDGHLRHAEFKRIREDKTLRQVPQYPEQLKRGT